MENMIFPSIAENQENMIFTSTVLQKCCLSCSEYAYERYRNLSEEENKKRQYGREWYKNLSEDEKQRLIEYKKNILKHKK